MRAGFRLPWRTRYIVIGSVALVTVVGLIGWHFFGGRGEVFKPDGGPVSRAGASFIALARAWTMSARSRPQATGVPLTS